MFSSDVFCTKQGQAIVRCCDMGYFHLIRNKSYDNIRSLETIHIIIRTFVSSRLSTYLLRLEWCLNHVIVLVMR